MGVFDYITDPQKIFNDIKQIFDFSDTEWRNYIIKNFVFSTCIFIAAIVIFYAATDSNSLSNRTFTYAFLIGIPLILGILYGANIKNLDDKGYVNKFLLGALLLFSLTVIISYLSSSTLPTFATINNLIVFLIVIMLLIGLAIVYNFSSSLLKEQKGIIGFIVNLIFFIPCLLNDFLIYVKNQIGITSSVVLILFFLEILCILLYIFIPKLFYSWEKKNSVVLMENPIFLVEKQVISNSDMFLLKESIPLKDAPINQDKPELSYRNSNYAFSFWVYINSENNNQMNSKNYKNIFSYANGKPSVKYYNNKFIIHFTNNRNGSNKNDYEIELPAQKWNNFTFNYLNNNVDLFVNGNLEISFSFNDNNVPLVGTGTDNVIVGDTDGLEGSICNVRYYEKSLISSEIKNNYYLLATLNPPVMN